MGYYLNLLVVGISIGMVFALVALGISLIFSGLDIVHFAHGEIYMLGAFLGLALYQGMKFVVGYPGGWGASNVVLVHALPLLGAAILSAILMAAVAAGYALLRRITGEGGGLVRPAVTIGAVGLASILALSLGVSFSFYLPSQWTSYTIGQLPRLPYPVAILLGALLTGLAGVLIERLCYRRLTSAGGGYTVAGLGIVVAGFGMSSVLQNLAFLNWGPKPLPFNVWSENQAIKIGDVSLSYAYIWIVVAAIVLMAGLNFLLRRTMVGLAIRAVAHNKDIAYLSGVNVPLMISIIFGTACALGAVGGILIGPINYPQVLMGVGILVKAFAAAVVGGFGSLPGAVLGGLLVGILESIGPATCEAAFITLGLIDGQFSNGIPISANPGPCNGTYKDIYAFILLIVVLLVKPTGILGVAAKVKA